MNKRCCTPTGTRRADEPLSAAAAPSDPCAGDPSSIADLTCRWCAIPAGEFTMGNAGADAVPGDGEGPIRAIGLDAFEIGATTVTNADFAAFVRATRYITDAERFGSSFVFYLQLREAQRAAAAQVVSGLPWWVPVGHACWQRPEGPGSHVHDRLGHPVVNVSWNDAQAYCAWSGTRLPSEAEWERAARGGLEGRRFAWGDELAGADGQPRANVFRGRFPDAPAPGWQPGPVDAGAGEPNGFGLYNVCGNVWEWCADRFSAGDGQAASGQEPPPGRSAARCSMRGGSFLCHDSYCNRYRVAARGSNTPDSAASNIGFRVAR